MARKNSRRPKAPEKAPNSKPKQGGASQSTGPTSNINEVLEKGIITRDLLKAIEDGKGAGTYPVIIEVSLDYPRGTKAARDKVWKLVPEAVKPTSGTVADQTIDEPKSQYSEQYVFAELSASAISTLVKLDARKSASLPPGAIFHIWLDHPVRGLIHESIRTVKADAASVSFAAHGKGIVWAVIDSGIDEDHPHFVKHKNLQLPKGIEPRDFTAPDKQKGRSLQDQCGHGTHVAGIIAGELRPARRELRVKVHRSDDDDGEELRSVKSISGMAPECKLLSLRALNDKGNGTVSNIIAALEYIDLINDHGRPPLKIHGVNLSLGNDYDPEWFACGESPLCATVNRLVRSGVVVVAAAGNSGYVGKALEFPSKESPGPRAMTINDPGNAELAITVGSTHRTMPYRYGVSYFSSKGPTGDGRAKPDLLAPGERIVSCLSAQMLSIPVAGKKTAKPVLYREESGTSMAAPHVSGVIAAFLSIRNEFIGRPDEVKNIFLETASDLHRVPSFQGRGLVDLMRAIQSV
jgi:subtilisin family serine protease